MKINTLQELPEEVKEIVFSSKITDINREIANKFSLNFAQIDYIVNLETPLFLKEIPVLDLPQKLENIEGAQELDLRSLSLEIAYKILWPLQDYLGQVDRLILRLGGKVPRLKHLRKVSLQHELFPDEDKGTLNNFLKKYEDFKDLRLSSKKIINKDNKKVTPTVDNWIKDYIHFLGASSHNSLERSKYFSRNKNILALKGEEKKSLIEFLIAYDKESVVNIINNYSLLRVSKYIPQEKEVKEDLDLEKILEELHQDLLALEKDILPSDYILSEVDNNIAKVGDLLWSTLGLDDTEKSLACLKVLINRKSLDRLFKEDKRFQSILKRFLTVKYGQDIAYNFEYKDQLMNRRIFLEMILEDKLKNKKATVLAYYLTNLIKDSGQVVYLDEADGLLKWRELQVINKQLAWVT